MGVLRDEIVLGQGDVYFGRFVDGTTVPDGEVFLGNTLAFSITRDITTQTRFASFDGQKIEQPATVTAETHSVTFNTENLTADNVALWFGGDPFDLIQVTTTGLTDTFTVKQGRFYQLGTGQRAPGLRNVANVVVVNGADVVTPAGNYTVDPAAGRIKILPGAPDIDDGASLAVTYDLLPTARKGIISARKELLGSLRFEATNRFGENKHAFYPFVHLKVQGAWDMKSDSWANLSFTVTGRRLNKATEYVYIDTEAA